MEVLPIGLGTCPTRSHLDDLVLYAQLVLLKQDRVKPEVTAQMEKSVAAVEDGSEEERYHYIKGWVSRHPVPERYHPRRVVPDRRRSLAVAERSRRC